MTKHPYYLAYGLLLLGLAGLAQYRGWSLFSLSEARQVAEASPGGVRPFLRGHPGFFGGK